MNKCPHTLDELVGAFWYLYDSPPAYDSTNPNTVEEANKLWYGLEEWCRRELTDYFGRPGGVQ